MRTLYFTLGLLVSALATTSVVAIFSEHFHPHAWLPPCTLSKLVGHQEKQRNRTWWEKLGWHVVDGDTIRCENRSIRLVGFDTPETASKKACRYETGVIAKERVEQLMRDARAWQVTPARTSRRFDRYDRLLAKLTVDGQDIADTLVAERLALRWASSENSERPNWCDHLAFGFSPL